MRVCLRYRVLCRRLDALTSLPIDPALPCPLVLVSHVERK